MEQRSPSAGEMEGVPRAAAREPAKLALVVPTLNEVPFSFGPREAGKSKAGIKEDLHYLSLLGRLYRAGNLSRRTGRR